MNSTHTTTGVWVGLVRDPRRTMCVWSVPRDSFLLTFGPKVKGCYGVHGCAQDIKLFKHVFSAFSPRTHDWNTVHTEEITQTTISTIAHPSRITWWNIPKMMPIDSENIQHSYLWQAARADPQPCDLADKLLVHLFFFFAHSAPQSVSQTFPENSQTLHPCPPPLASSSCWSLSLSDGLRLRGCPVYNARVGLWHPANGFTVRYALCSPGAGAEIVRVQNSKHASSPISNWVLDNGYHITTCAYMCVWMLVNAQTIQLQMFSGSNVVDFLSSETQYGYKSETEQHAKGFSFLPWVIVRMRTGARYSPPEPSLLYTDDRLHTAPQSGSGSLAHSMVHHPWKTECANVVTLLPPSHHQRPTIRLLISL